MTNFRENRRLAADKTTDKMKLEFEPISPPSPQGEELSVQFVPGAVSSVSAAMQRVLDRWREQTLTQDSYGDSHLIRGQGEWQRLRAVALGERAASASSAGCSLPSSAQLEHDSSFGRILDLSGWSDEDHEASSSSSTSSLCLFSLVETFAADPDVLSVAVQGRPVLLNYDARGVAQSGSSYSTPFTTAGLYGTGQVVGVADSGLDDYSCYFWDNTGVYGTAYTQRSSFSYAEVQNERRKVVMYVSYGDAYDQAVGHGTHVVGTIVGSSVFGEFSGGNGVAPGGKVAFYDVMAGSNQYLTIPDVGTMFGHMYDAGARVMSNSWGSFTAECELHCRALAL